MKNYWLIAAAIVFALIVGALTPQPRDRLARAPGGTGESHVVHLDTGSAYDWRATPNGGEKQF